MAHAFDRERRMMHDGQPHPLSARPTGNPLHRSSQVVTRPARLSDNTRYMPATSRTSEFRQLLKEKENVFPDPKRRKRTKRASADSQREGDELLNRQYINDAYSVVRPPSIL